MNRIKTDFKASAGTIYVDKNDLIEDAPNGRSMLTVRDRNIVGEPIKEKTLMRIQNIKPSRAIVSIEQVGEKTKYVFRCPECDKPSMTVVRVEDA